MSTGRGTTPPACDRLLTRIADAEEQEYRAMEQQAIYNASLAITQGLNNASLLQGQSTASGGWCEYWVDVYGIRHERPEYYTGIR